MVWKIIFCSEFPDIPDTAGRKTRRRITRTQAIAKRYELHANAIIVLLFLLIQITITVDVTI